MSLLDPGKGDARGGSGRGVESVARATSLLDALADRERGLVDLAGRTGLHPSTTHRLLSTLIQCGYVQRGVDPGKYALGLRALRLSTGAARATEGVASVVKPYMDRVHRVSRETTNLFLAAGSEVALLEQIVAPGGEALRMDHGIHLPPHATASGKAMLAFSDPELVERELVKVELRQYTRRTIVGTKRIMRELKAIRERGFSIGYHEYTDRTTGIAAPMLAGDDRVIGALGVSLQDPGGRALPDENIGALGELVGRAAMEASFELGYAGPSPWHPVQEAC